MWIGRSPPKGSKLQKIDLHEPPDNSPVFSCYVNIPGTIREFRGGNQPGYRRARGWGVTKDLTELYFLGMEFVLEQNCAAVELKTHVCNSQGQIVALALR